MADEFKVHIRPPVVACVGCTTLVSVTEEVLLNIWGLELGVMICQDCREKLEKPNGQVEFAELWHKVAAFAAHQAAKFRRQQIDYTQFEGPRSYAEVMGDL